MSGCQKNESSGVGSVETTTASTETSSSQSTDSSETTVNSSVGNSETTPVESGSVAPEDLPLIGTNRSAHINLFSDEAEDSAPLGFEDEWEDGEEITWKARFAASVSDYPEIPLRFFMIADGEPIAFSLNDSDEAEAQDITVVSDEETIAELHFQAPPQANSINVMAMCFPELVPNEGSLFTEGSSGYEIQYSVTRTNSPTSSPESDDGEYISFQSTQETRGIYLGLDSIQDTGGAPRDSDYDFRNTLSLSPDKDFYLKCNLTGDSPYYLLLFCDGMPIPLSDGGYSVVADCENATKTFQYKIPREILPTTGTHAFMGVALAANPIEGAMDDGTARVRVNTAEGG